MFSQFECSKQPFLQDFPDQVSMSMYELLETRVNRNFGKPVRLYELLEKRIEARQATDKLWALLALRSKELDQK